MYNPQSNNRTVPILPHTPATKEYWLEFYDKGEGRNETFEWYFDSELALNFFKKHLKKGDKILHVGCGNSRMAELILQDKQFPEDLFILNVDICENVIEKMKARLNKILSQEITPDLAKRLKKYEMKKKLRPAGIEPATL